MIRADFNKYRYRYEQNDAPQVENFGSLRKKEQ
jgi:hypothetical protein